MINKDIRNIIPIHKTRKPEKRNSASHIIIHTTASNNQDPMKIAEYHITPSSDNHLSKKGAPTIAYSDVINKEGIVFHCVDYTSVTWHAKYYNNCSIGIALAYNPDKQNPTEEQHKSMIQLSTILCLYMKILPKNVLGHRELPWMSQILGNGSIVYRKTCPGMCIDLNEVRKEVTYRLQTRLASEGLYKYRIDGIFGEKSIMALKLFNPTNSSKINWFFNV